MSHGSLSERTILVTGATRGIGAATVRLLAREGADIAVGYHVRCQLAKDVVTELRDTGVRAEAFGADLADLAQARRMVADVEECFGRIDGLVNNAGIMPESAFLEMTDQEWDLVLRTNLYSAYACAKAVLPGMVERGAGSIVMMASRLGQVGWPHLAHYSVSKAGLIVLAKSLAREFGPAGIRVNTIAPGVTLTDMGRTVAEGETGRQRMAELPLGRFGEPDEVAETVAFLLSDDASLFLGQTLCPNSGGYMP